MTDEGATGTPGGLAEAMRLIALSLQEEHWDVEATLQSMTRSAVESIPGAEECGVSYVTGRSHVESRAVTGDLPRLLDVLQNEMQEGPCFDALWTDETLRVDDVATELRWPRFAVEAYRLGAGSILAFRLFVEDRSLGALNVYSRSSSVFGEDAEVIGRIFAGHAAIALASAQHVEHLRMAISNRDLIGQAKGILMERHKLTADQAFSVLTRISQQTNRKLVDIAQELNGTGALPTTLRRD